jgi:hypothetical protein
VEEIISINYGKFEVVMLYCTWARTNRNGVCVTMKSDEYSFTLFKFDHLIPYSTDSFVFPIHLQQVFLWIMGGMMDGKLFCGESHEAVEFLQRWMKDQICRHCK